MFKKLIKIKNHTRLKKSETRQLRDAVQFHFAICDDDLVILFPPKEPVFAVKVMTKSQEEAIIYICQSIPLFYELEDVFHPTVFTLWKFPLIVVHIVVHDPVKACLLNKGADLMIPGIVCHQEHLTENNLPPGAVVAMCTGDNIAAFCVGQSLVWSHELVRPGNKGKGVKIYHTLNDELSKMYENGNIELPFVGNPFDTKDLKDSVGSMALFDKARSKDSDSDDDDDEEIIMTPDELLTYCFLKGMKKHHSNLTFPILTNIFYKNCMLDVVPKNMTLDIKKTTYKKLSVFLSKMSDNKVLCLDLNKGVQSITSVNMNHEMFETFVDHFEEVILKNDNIPQVMEVIERSVVNSQLEPICSQFSRKKGDCLTDEEVRKILTNYIKVEELQDPYSKEFVTLNGTLCDVLQTRDIRMPWKTMFDTVLKNMSKCYEIRTPNNQVITGKGKLPHIEITVTVKTSNKKVTLVKNLEIYGINIQEFSKECQHGVAASSTVCSLPTAKSPVLQVQGNQRKFIGQLLQEKYLVPKKYIDGLEEQKTKKR